MKVFARRWRLVLPWLGVLAATVLVGANGTGKADSVRALAEANDLVAAGELEQAVAVYRSGYDPERPHPSLTYNLGTILHRLDRLPEAVLWYRRSPQTDDPWLEENLWLARRSLGSQQLPGGTLGALASQADRIALVGIASAWLVLLLVSLGDRLPRKLTVAAGLASVLLYGSAYGLHRWGPRPAVLLADCESSGVELPAGTEAWVLPAGDIWQIAGASHASCPDESIGLVSPR
ncbi:MAG: hypothetical protein MPN21_14170 [Thermoanaerobaculia bacterium]|nr:hypothetical protein [Thermoanaerobaculia bacterium]